MTESTGDIIAGLWENGRDSKTHAFHHFSERSAARDIDRSGDQSDIFWRDDHLDDKHASQWPGGLRSDVGVRHSDRT